MRITHGIEIDRSPPALWPWLTEPERAKLWMKGLEKIEPVAADELRVGARYELHIREGRKVSVYDEEITELDPPRALGLTISGGPFQDRLRMQVRYALTPIGGARTRLDYECQADARGIWRLLSAVFGIFARVQMKLFLRRLKQLAEADGGASNATGGSGTGG